MPDYDAVFRNALIYDGTGAAPRRASLAIKDDRIAALGEVAADRAREVVEAGHLALAPGFIDAHTHDDRIVLDAPDMLPKISQGVTTVVTGNCGISLAPVTFMDDPPPPMNLLGGASAYGFPSFAAYERYREQSFQDAECQAAFRYAEETRCIISYERSFFRPVFE